MEFLVVIMNTYCKGMMQRLMVVDQADLDVICAKRVCNVQMDTTTVVLTLATGICVFVVMNRLQRNDRIYELLTLVNYLALFSLYFNITLTL